MQTCLFLRRSYTRVYVYPLQRHYAEINVYPGKFVISEKSRAASSRFEPADAAFISMIRPKGVRRAAKLARIQYSPGQIIPGVCQHRLISRDAIKYTRQIPPYRGANSLLNDTAAGRTEKCNRPSPPLPPTLPLLLLFLVAKSEFACRHRYYSARAIAEYFVSCNASLVLHNKRVKNKSHVGVLVDG